MKRRQHGVLSLVVLFAAIIIGIYAIAQVSPKTAIAYTAITFVGLLIVVYSFCAKCPCRKGACGHVILGLVTSILPTRKETEYTTLDYLGVIIPLGFILLAPQIWLKNNVPLLIAFWLLAAVALLEIILRVCRGCENNYCPIRSKVNSL